MKKGIAKILIFLMVFTTVFVPASTSFGIETQASESNAQQQSLPLDGQETPAVESTLPSVSTETQPSEVAVPKENAVAQETAAVEKKMDFLYIESKEIEAPGTQNIVVSWDKNLSVVSEMKLVYEDSKGTKFETIESKRTDTSVLFTQSFKSGEEGDYRIRGIKYTIDGVESFFEFNDVEIAAKFKVIKAQETLPGSDAIITVDVNEKGTVNSATLNSELKDAALSVEEGQAPKTRSAKAAGVVIVLDPGHGGEDPGACANGAREGDINYKIATYCKQELENYAGVKVYLTRSENQNPSLSERAKIAASYHANILVSLHINSIENSAVNGAEVYYPNKNYKPEVGNTGKAVATEIQKELVALGISDRGIKTKLTADGTKYPDGSYSDYYGIIRHSKLLGIPGIIVEHAFISSESDYNKFLNSDAKLKKIGIADAKGIARAYNLDKGSWVPDGNGNWKYKFADGTFAKDQWLKISGCWYYVNGEGLMVTGVQSIRGNTYCFADDGIMFTGWKRMGSTWYYLQSNGAAKIGWFKLGSKWYYSDADGKMQTGAKNINGVNYVFAPSGAMLTGWQKVDGSWYYLQSNGVAKTGWFKSGRTWYCFDKTGVMYTGAKKVGNYTYVFAPGGAMLTGWQRVGSTWYCLQSNGVARTGWFKSGRTWYCFDKTGAMYTGAKKVGSYTYVFAPGGAMLTGWQRVGSTWYCLQSNGVARIGWFKSGTKWYYFDTAGKMLVGTHVINGKEYTFDRTGAWMIGYEISGASSVTVNQLVKYYKSRRAYPSYYATAKSDAPTIEDFCKIYYEEAKAENIRAEVAFCQAMKETGWLKFGGDVSISQYNFAGLGATGNGNPGNSFDSVRMGARAHIQHLKAYANKEPLNNECVDIRFDYVKRGCAPYVEWLGMGANPEGKGWAPAATYGVEIVNMIKEVKRY